MFRLTGVVLINSQIWLRLVRLVPAPTSHDLRRLSPSWQSPDTLKHQGEVQKGQRLQRSWPFSQGTRVAICAYLSWTKGDEFCLWASPRTLRRQVHTEPWTGVSGILQREVTQALLLRENSKHQHSQLWCLLWLTGARQKGHLGVAHQHVSLKQNLLQQASRAVLDDVSWKLCEDGPQAGQPQECKQLSCNK